MKNEKVKKPFYKRWWFIVLIVLIIISAIGSIGDDNDDEEEVTQNESSETDKSEPKETNEKEDPKEVKNEMKDNDLFNEVYYKIVSKDQINEKDSIITYLEANDFIIFDENIELNSFQVKDDKTTDEDYVYIVFDKVEDEPDIELVSSISYYLEQEELEVGFYNYSPNKDAQYDSLKTHKIGESEKEVKSLEEQITFLKGTKNEHKVKKDKVKEKVLENEKKDPIELVIDVKEIIEDGKVLFNINTNLPDNTTGTVTLKSKSNSIDYIGQAKFEVKNGKAEAGPYSMKGEPVPSGSYEVSISTPISEIQPDDALIEIGEDYNNYTGDQFNDGKLGRNISYSFEINIP